MNKNELKLLLEFIQVYVNLNNYENIIELEKSCEDSVCKLLKSNSSFLLSKKVSKENLISNNLNGCYGYVSKQGILCKSAELVGDLPNFNENSLLISEKNISEIINTTNLNTKRIIATCLDLNDPKNNEIKNFYIKLNSILNNLENSKNKLIDETYNNLNKELIMIKKI